jgi:hypothetical protein
MQSVNQRGQYFVPKNEVPLKGVPKNDPKSKKINLCYFLH